jgi:TolB-like protein
MLPQNAFSPELIRSQLEKILLSAGFARNVRLSGFLRFVVEQDLAGRLDELKESVIGVEYFGRRSDYDVRRDSVVRNEAGKLRARLAEYYIGAGARDELIIELPKGGYKPEFRQIEKTAAPAPEPESARRRVWIWPAVALAGCCFVLLVLWWRGVLHRNTPIPIAVLPLVNLDQDPGHGDFSEGLTDEIIRNLSIIDGLAVRSQTSSFAFKGKPQNVHDVGKRLDVDYILEGSVLQSGQQLRINAQLVRVRDDFPLWSGKYDGELTDVFAIQDEISRGIVNELRLKLGHGRRRYETSAEAYDLYLHARALQISAWRRRARRKYRSAGGSNRQRPLICTGLRSLGFGLREQVRSDPTGYSGRSTEIENGGRPGYSFGPSVSRGAGRSRDALCTRCAMGRGGRELPPRDCARCGQFDGAY